MLKSTDNANAAANRNQAIDLAKGIALLCIIAAHIGLPAHNVTVLLYSFHVPVFFVASGWFFDLGSAAGRPSFLRYVGRKAKGLLKPYLVLAAIIILYQLVANGLSAGLTASVLLLVQRRYTTLWFLTTLFLANIIFYPTVRLLKRPFLILPVSGVLSALYILYDTHIGTPLPWNLDVAFIAQIFLACGYAFRSVIERVASMRKPVPLFTGVLGMLLCFGLTELNRYLGFESFEMFFGRYGWFPMTVTAAMLGSLGLILICGSLRIGAISSLGRNSLVYFGLHQVVAIPVAFKALSLLHIENGWLRFALSFPLVLLICFAIDMLLKLTGIKKWMSRR